MYSLISLTSLHHIGDAGIFSMCKLQLIPLGECHPGGSPLDGQICIYHIQCILTSQRSIFVVPESFHTIISQMASTILTYCKLVCVCAISCNDEL